MSQQLRFHDGSLGAPSDSTLRTLDANLSGLPRNERNMLFSHLHDGGSDVWAFEWLNLLEGQRSEHSEVVRSKRRVVAKVVTLPALLEAIEQNERDLNEARNRSFNHIAA